MFQFQSFLNCTANIYLSTFNNRLGTTKLFSPPSLHISIIYPNPLLLLPFPLLFINENSNWIPNQANIANGGQPQKGVYQQQMRRPQQVGTLGNRCHTRRRDDEGGWGEADCWDKRFDASILRLLEKIKAQPNLHTI